jgi:2,4-diketo-3-deoxy-L-fuconate hydrolase
MSERKFVLGTFSAAEDREFVGAVVGNRVIPITELASAGVAARALGSIGTMADLLEEWERNFALVCDAVAIEIAAAGEHVRASYALAALRVHPPVPRPGKILNSAANFRGHVKEMATYTHSAGSFDRSKSFTGDKAVAQPYLFLKAPSALIGAYDDIVLPDGEHTIDWECEMAVVIGTRTRRMPAKRAMDCVAGFMTFNDVSCRDMLFREDRQTFRTDWLSSKSHDTFAPSGPFLVPRAFVTGHEDLPIRLSVNGEIMQDGSTADMIYSPEEQIAYASKTMTLLPGDVFATGTTAGVGEAKGIYLSAGDVIEAEVGDLGMQRNRVVPAPLTTH